VDQSGTTNVLIGVLDSSWNRAVTRSECYHNSGGNHPCQISKFYMILFGIVQIIMLSPIPDFNENQLWWVSGLLSFISYIYSIIGLRLGIAKVIGMILFMLC